MYIVFVIAYIQDLFYTNKFVSSCGPSSFHQTVGLLTNYRQPLVKLDEKPYDHWLEELRL